VALPLTAVLTLGASSLDMGVLTASSTLPALLLALHIGVWVDRFPRRPILIATNLGRAALVGLVPLSAALGWLTMHRLWVLVFAIGTLAVAFDIAVTSYVPSLVPRGRLLEANATLQASSAAARAAGPGTGGWLVQALGAPVALWADALSFALGAALLAPLSVPEPTRDRAVAHSVWTAIGEGVAAVWHDRLLRAMVAASTIAAFGGAMQQAVYVLFAVRDVEVTPPVLGTILACGSMAGLVGAAMATRTARRLGTGGALVLSQLTITASVFVLAAAPPGGVGIVLLAVAQVLFSAGLQTFSVTQISLRQAITPSHLLGRVNATRRVTVFGMQPIGAVLGGALGSAFGLHAALLAAAALQLIALASLLASPLRAARQRRLTNVGCASTTWTPATALATCLGQERR
jgi:MFS family permease